MTINESHPLILTKVARRALREKVVLENIVTICTSINTKSLKGMGWVLEKTPLTNGWAEVQTLRNPDGSILERHYEMTLTLAYSGVKNPGSNDVASLARRIADRTEKAQFGTWTLTKVDDKDYVPSGDSGLILDNIADQVGYTDVIIPDDFEQYFGELYGLDDQIGLVKDAVSAGVDSGWQHRPHVLLVGPPACGKSELCIRLQEALGEDAVVRYDGPSLTSAGAIKDLTDREILPRVMVIEEAEKVSKDEVCDFLLGVMDQRAEIRKTTARTNVQRDAKMFVIATVNDYPKFQKMRSGALASRFNNPIGFKRPSRELLSLILHRELIKIGGDEAWIQPTLDYCDQEGINDPRRVVSIMVTGRDKLLTGEHQRRLQATRVDIINQIADWTGDNDAESEEG